MTATSSPQCESYVTPSVAQIFRNMSMFMKRLARSWFFRGQYEVSWKKPGLSAPGPSSRRTEHYFGVRRGIGPLQPASQASLLPKQPHHTPQSG